MRSGGTFFWWDSESVPFIDRDQCVIQSPSQLSSEVYGIPTQHYLKRMTMTKEGAPLQIWSAWKNETGKS